MSMSPHLSLPPHSSKSIGIVQGELALKPKYANPPPPPLPISTNALGHFILSEGRQEWDWRWGKHGETMGSIIMSSNLWRD